MCWKSLSIYGKNKHFQLCAIQTLKTISKLNNTQQHAKQRILKFNISNVHCATKSNEWCMIKKHIKSMATQTHGWIAIKHKHGNRSTCINCCAATSTKISTICIVHQNHVHFRSKRKNEWLKWKQVQQHTYITKTTASFKNNNRIKNRSTKAQQTHRMLNQRTDAALCENRMMHARQIETEKYVSIENARKTKPSADPTASCTKSPAHHTVPQLQHCNVSSITHQK